MKHCRPKKNDSVISYMIRMVNRPSFTEISVAQLMKNLKIIDEEIDLDSVIAKTNRCLINYEVVKTKILGKKKQYIVLRRIVDSTEKEPFIPNDNLVKQRKIEFQNPHVVLQAKEYTASEDTDKTSIIRVQKNALVDKTKILQNLNTENYYEILAKIKGGVLIHNVAKLSEEERITILAKFYEASETTHSFTVFKQSFLNFLYVKKIQDSKQNRRIFEFLKKEIEKL